MADDTVPDDAVSEQPAAEGEVDDRHPRGTLLITSLFLVALIVVWAAMYFMMLSRS